MEAVTIVFTVCRLLSFDPAAATDSAECRNLQLRGYGTLQACMLAAQPTVAAWLQLFRPGWYRDGAIRCVVGDRPDPPTRPVALRTQR